MPQNVVPIRTEPKTTNAATSSTLTFYPAYCFKASPVFDTWVKLTAAGIHKLRKRRGFEGQPIHFHLNHPIQYVQVTGLVIEFEVKDTHFTFVLDDGSGETISVYLSRPRATEVPGVARPGQLLPILPGELEGKSSLGNKVDLTGIDIGTVVKAKGTVGEYFGEKQVLLERIFIVPTTTAEIASWESTAALYHNVLSKPWTLSESQVRKLKAETDGSKARKEERKQKKEEKKLRGEARAKRDAERKSTEGSKAEELLNGNGKGVDEKERKKPLVNGTGRPEKQVQPKPATNSTNVSIPKEPPKDERKKKRKSGDNEAPPKQGARKKPRNVQEEWARLTGRKA